MIFSKNEMFYFDYLAMSSCIKRFKSIIYYCIEVSLMILDNKLNEPMEIMNPIIPLYYGLFDHALIELDSCVV